MDYVIIQYFKGMISELMSIQMSYLSCEGAWDLVEVTEGPGASHAIDREEEGWWEYVILT